ncbi:MAG: glycosyltransferase family 1 protein, partial [Lachnospiraceae bacterium]|nr:glycosyltransferase family 1 protein [Lachnospiraceae bacterium]
ELYRVFPVESEPSCAEPKGYRYANYFIDRKITQIERIRLLNGIGERFGEKNDLKLFTLDSNYKIKGISNMGVAEYNSEMPYVFRDSRINLNITLRSIKYGIPLRCMDILGCGGFLLTNYQPDFLIDFVPGQDFVYYEDMDDMLGKIDYYLSHESERADIAAAGADKARTLFSLKAVYERIFEIAGI